MARLPVAHYCDCQHCTVEFDYEDVAEGPLTLKQYERKERSDAFGRHIAEIYKGNIEMQLGAWAGFVMDEALVDLVVDLAKEDD